MRFVVVAVLIAACGDDEQPVRFVDAGQPDVLGCPAPRLSVCNPLTQSGCCSGEKCTWIVDQVTPQLIGHVGCAPDGYALEGEPCRYRPSIPGWRGGYDGCAEGLVCSDRRGELGTCKRICDQQGGFPMCPGDAQTCVTHRDLFYTSAMTPAAGGTCEPSCDPLADNDFDGSGSASERTGTVCGNDPTIGCYGFPSYGTPPHTGWSCQPESAPTLALRHRSELSDPEITVTSCSAGYLPLLYERTGATTIICVAMCKPLNCYAGNCGPNNENRLGEAPHRCTNPDRVGTFDTSEAGEHCQFLWTREVDQTGALLRSPTSDTVGFCFDHSKYRYDSNGDNQLTDADATLPPCASLQDGYGSGSDRSDPTTYFGAADLGCVDSTRYEPNHPPRY